MLNQFKGASQAFAIRAFVPTLLLFSMAHAARGATARAYIAQQDTTQQDTLKQNVVKQKPVKQKKIKYKFEVVTILLAPDSIPKGYHQVGFVSKATGSPVTQLNNGATVVTPSKVTTVVNDAVKVATLGSDVVFGWLNLNVSKQVANADGKIADASIIQADASKGYTQAALNGDLASKTDVTVNKTTTTTLGAGAVDGNGNTVTQNSGNKTVTNTNSGNKTTTTISKDNNNTISGQSSLTGAAGNINTNSGNKVTTTGTGTGTGTGSPAVVIGDNSDHDNDHDNPVTTTTATGKSTIGNDNDHDNNHNNTGATTTTSTTATQNGVISQGSSAPVSGQYGSSVGAKGGTTVTGTDANGTTSNAAATPLAASTLSLKTTGTSLSTSPTLLSTPLLKATQSLTGASGTKTPVKPVAKPAATAVDDLSL